jgi:hypothetical protein
MIGGLTETLKRQGVNGSVARRQAYGMISYMIDNQATTLAYVQVISVMAVIVLCLVPFLLIMRRNKPAPGEQQPAMH